LKPSESGASILWRRLDTPGHDACRIEQTNDGWTIEGIAVFRHETGPASIEYSVQCDAGWRTLSGRLRGLMGERRIDYAVAHQGADWILNGRTIPGIGHLQDLDLSFTPATNFPQIRRVPMPREHAVELPVAWLDPESGMLSELRQTYERKSDLLIWYAAPQTGYEGILELAPNGFIRRYPGLWEAE
jgi:uncharacterized protein